MTTLFSSTGVPLRLRVNDVSNAVGTPVSVYFGWELEHPEPNQIQTGYQILVASSAETLAANVGDRWDSGAVNARTQNHVAYAGAPLKSSTRYVWKVRYWDREGGVSEYAAPAAFTVGLLTNEDWAGAQWIRRESAETDDYTYYRKRFRLQKAEIERATVYVSAVHKYELYLNGKNIGTGPAYHYPQYQYYNAYDVTGNLKTDAENVLAVLTHWFGAGQGRPESARGLILKLVVEYANGTSTVIGTDASWKQRRAESWALGQAKRNDEGVGYVERIDARRLRADWDAVEFDDGKWDAAVELGAQPTDVWTGHLNADLTRVSEETVRPAVITQNAKGAWVVDLGKVYAGRPRIEFTGGAAGQVVTVRGGYALDAGGGIDPQQNQETDMTYFAILNGGAWTFLPCEYLGMRYVEIENAPMPVTQENFSFLARHTELDETRSAFASSDATLNAVWDLMKYSVRVGAQEQFLDTPTREKGGFLVDSMNESLAAMGAYGERALTRRTLGEFLQSMEQYWSGEQDRGRMNAVYPNGDGARDIPDFTQAYLVWVWEYYLQTGDAEFLRAHYAQLKSIADCGWRYRDEETGLISELRGGGGAYLYGIVDWVPSMRYGYDMETAARTVINCYAYEDAELFAKIAEVLGKTEDAATYRARAGALKDAVNTHLLQNIYADGLYRDGAASAHRSQQANIFPLALGMVPQEKRGAVLEHVKGLGMRSGMVTVYWLVRALGEMGAGEALLALYTDTAQDGWAKTLAQGATCTWESWDAHLGGNLSQSHPWGAVGVVGIQQYVLGVRPLAPQCERVDIKPLDFGEKLNFAEGRVPTERGEIFVRWERTAERYEMRVELPVNVEARVWVLGTGDMLWVDGEKGEARMEGDYFVVEGVGSGKHTFRAGSTGL